MMLSCKALTIHARKFRSETIYFAFAQRKKKNPELAADGAIGARGRGGSM